MLSIMVAAPEGYRKDAECREEADRFETNWELGRAPSPSVRGKAE